MYLAFLTDEHPYIIDWRLKQDGRLHLRFPGIVWRDSYVSKAKLGRVSSVGKNGDASTVNAASRNTEWVPFMEVD